MYLKSITGEVLFEGRFSTVKKAVEAAVIENVCLDRVDLRHANLKGAALDDASLKGASLWGANLEKADLTAADLQDGDCRNANFKDCCLAESNCAKADFRGSYFAQTILTAADLSKTKFSCPSLFKLNLSDVLSFKDAVYSHKGEVDCDLSVLPIVIYGLPKNIILMKDKILIGTSLYNIGMHHHIFSGFQKAIHQEKLFKSRCLKE